MTEPTIEQLKAEIVTLKAEIVALRTKLAEPACHAGADFRFAGIEAHS